MSSAGGGGCLPSAWGDGCTPPLCGQTDTCENMTFPQLLLRVVIIERTNVVTENATDKVVSDISCNVKCHVR